MFFRIPEDVITRLVLVLVVWWGWCLSPCANQPGDYVLWNPKEHPHALRSSKLAPKLLGPYLVNQQLGNDVHCNHCQLNTPHVFHADRLTPFFGTEVDAKTLSLLDKDEFLIESIIFHRGSLDNKSQLYFLVH